MLNAATIRQRIASALHTALSGDGWRQSVFVPSAGMLDAQGASSRLYSVEVPETEVVDPRHRSGGGAEGTYVQTTVRVRALYRIRADRQTADYDAGLDLEDTLTSAIGSSDWSGCTPIAFDRLTRQLSGDGAYLVLEVVGSVRHRTP